MTACVDPEGVRLVSRGEINENRPVVNVHLVDPHRHAVAEDERGELCDAVAHVTLKDGNLLRMIPESEIPNGIKSCFGIPPVIIKGMCQISGVCGIETE